MFTCVVFGVGLVILIMKTDYCVFIFQEYVRLFLVDLIVILIMKTLENVHITIFCTINHQNQIDLAKLY